VPTDRSNLVWRAAEAFGIDAGAAIALEKHLPHAGGIGGGSADAGAALRGLVELWDVAPPGLDALLAIGADTPVCAACAPARMRGSATYWTRCRRSRPCGWSWLNPGVEVPTGPVFKALASVENAPMPEPEWSDANGLLRWLAGTRNDLEPAARAMVPAVGDVLDALGGLEGCGLARMSGSGATCFGVFTDERVARDGAERLRSVSPDWWVEAAPVLTRAPSGGDQVRRATT
jgi:4-diphosphocytidyl-2-C-methyl-D-erythritol kinase